MSAKMGKVSSASDPMPEGDPAYAVNKPWAGIDLLQDGAGVVHDLKNCMTTALFCSHRLKNRLESGRSIAVEEFQQLESVLLHCADLSKHLLLGSGSSCEPPPMIDVGQTLWESAPLFKMVLMGRHSLAMVLPDAPLYTLASPTLIQRIICNLLNNAKDAIEGSGHVGIRLAPVSPSETDQWASITVTDDGSGMSKEVQDMMFRPFFTTKPPGRGMGLGLANVKALTEELGGTIGVQSALGQGTSISIRFPAWPGGVRKDGTSLENELNSKL